MYKIAIMPGDGIGSEVIEEAIKVLNATELEYEKKNVTSGEPHTLKMEAPSPRSLSKHVKTLTPSSSEP